MFVNGIMKKSIYIFIYIFWNIKLKGVGITAV